MAMARALAMAMTMALAMALAMARAMARAMAMTMALADNFYLMKSFSPQILSIDCPTCEQRTRTLGCIKSKVGGLWRLMNQYFCEKCNTKFSVADTVIEKPSKFERKTL
jgi:transposase-like protein